MPKDTKSSGYNKAPACESRGFGHKKEGENFDTPSFHFFIICRLSASHQIICGKNLEIVFFSSTILMGLVINPLLPAARAASMSFSKA